MIIEYRIEENNRKHHPQVRWKHFMFWSDWKKIIRVPFGYTLHALPNYDYPISFNECEEMIEDFDVWLKNETKKKENGKYTPYRTKEERSRRTQK